MRLILRGSVLSSRFLCYTNTHLYKYILLCRGVCVQKESHDLFLVVCLTMQCFAHSISYIYMWLLYWFFFPPSTILVLVSVLFSCSLFVCTCVYVCSERTTALLFWWRRRFTWKGRMKVQKHSQIEDNFTFRHWLNFFYSETKKLEDMGGAEEEARNAMNTKNRNYDFHQHRHHHLNQNCNE